MIDLSSTFSTFKVVINSSTSLIWIFNSLFSSCSLPNLCCSSSKSASLQFNINMRRKKNVITMDLNYLKDELKDADKYSDMPRS